jgi:hypothetical protein
MFALEQGKHIEYALIAHSLMRWRFAAVMATWNAFDQVSCLR